MGGWGSSYLFFDFIRSWSEADTNAKEVLDVGAFSQAPRLRCLALRSVLSERAMDVRPGTGKDSGAASIGGGRSSA